MSNELEKKTVENVTIACQKIDLYRNSSPGPVDQPCFLIRQLIAEENVGSPLFMMAWSLDSNPEDPMLIKYNVKKIIAPVLDCLTTFVANYGNPNSSFANFEAAVKNIYQVLDAAHECVIEQGKELPKLLLAIKESIGKDLMLLGAELPKPANTAANRTSLLSIFQSPSRKHAKREEMLETIVNRTKAFLAQLQTSMENGVKPSP